MTYAASSMMILGVAIFLFGALYHRRTSFEDGSFLLSIFAFQVGGGLFVSGGVLLIGSLIWKALS